MDKLNLCLVGATGRLGLSVLKMLSQAEYSKQYNLVAAIVSKNSDYLNTSVASLSSIHTPLLFSEDLEKFLPQIQVILDCSLPAASMHNLALAQSAHKKMVLCATGFTSEQQASIQLAAQNIPVVVAPNTSMGMALTNRLIKSLAEKMSAMTDIQTDIQIVETHHIHKKDAPSGAAKQLAQTILEKTDKKPLITSLRMGEVVGEHTLFFTVQGEQIQLTHRALDRSIFALGALRAAKWLAKVVQPGFYTMENVLEDVFLLNQD